MPQISYSKLAPCRVDFQCTLFPGSSQIKHMSFAIQKLQINPKLRLACLRHVSYFHSIMTYLQYVMQNFLLLTTSNPSENCSITCGSTSSLPLHVSYNLLRLMDYFKSNRIQGQAIAQRMVPLVRNTQWDNTQWRRFD